MIEFPLDYWNFMVKHDVGHHNLGFKTWVHPGWVFTPKTAMGLQKCLCWFRYCAGEEVGFRMSHFRDRTRIWWFIKGQIPGGAVDGCCMIPGDLVKDSDQIINLIYMFSWWETFLWWDSGATHYTTMLLSQQQLFSNNFIIQSSCSSTRSRMDVVVVQLFALWFQRGVSLHVSVQQFLFTVSAVF